MHRRLDRDSRDPISHLPAFNSLYLPPGYPPPGLDRPHVDNGVGNDGYLVVWVLVR